MAQRNYGLIRRGTGRAVLESIPIPKLPDDYVLVRTVAIALNPTDWTTLEAPGDDGTLVGCDFSGVIVEVGEAMSERFEKGDKVTGFGHGGNDANAETGAFAKYIAVKGALVMHIPDNVSYEQAATVTVGVGTTGYALYNVLGLPFPGAGAKGSSKTVLVYGGSTATGTIAIQFAKLSGWKVITTCSPKHFPLVRERGADLVFNYRSPDVGQAIRTATKDELTIAFDTVSTEETAAICAEAIGSSGGQYGSLLGPDCPRSDVKSTFFLVYSMSGESYLFEGEHYEAKPDDLAFAKKFYPIAEQLWAKGKWVLHPQQVGTGGLLGAIDGMQQMKEGKVSGFKLVYRVDETKWPQAI